MVKKMSNYKFKSKKLYKKIIDEYVPPVITVKPRLNDYNLNNEMIDEYTAEKSIQEEKEKKVPKVILVSGLLFGFAFGILLIVETVDISFFEILWYMFLSCIGSVFFAFFLSAFVFKIRKNHPSKKQKKLMQIEKSIQSYQSDTRSYEYWIEIKKKEYWLNMNGHQFEKELAILYKKLGYKTSVTPQGGDQGIDILMSKNGQSIIVQCKAHKRPVGPATARDFYGTMVHNNIKYGIIASTNGFTKGVHDFVKGKKIKLITVNDIVEMENDL